MAENEDLDEKLSQFQDAIRAKDNWVTKILDERRSLAKKWAVEAGLWVDDEPVDEDEVTVVSALRELKAEANRIRILDSRVRFDASENACRTVDFDSIDVDIRNSLKYAREAEYAIHVPSPPLRQRSGVYISDDLVPASLHHELVTELDALAQKEPKDFHPGTYGKVQDLIHPSLYPLVLGATTINPSAEMPPVQNDEFVTHLLTQRTHEFRSKYAWIPSVFSVSEDGKDVHIESYINGLGPRDAYPNLYRVIEKIFLFALPHFEKTLEFKFENENTASEQRWMDRAEARGSYYDQASTHSEWQAVFDRQAQQKEVQMLDQKESEEKTATEAKQERLNKDRFSGLDDLVTASNDFMGAKLKVIVKAATYCLKPGQTYEGSWHIEGMPHERITASVIYYYDTDKAIFDAGLSLRRIRDEESDFPSINEFSHDSFKIYFADDEDGKLIDRDELDEGGLEKDYPSDWEHDPGSPAMSTGSLSNYIHAGTVATTNFAPFGEDDSRGTGRMLSFPNWLQHKVEEVTNKEDPETTSKQVAHRKILCFFLVQDDEVDEDHISYPGFRYIGMRGMNVLTTMDVPLQDRGYKLRHLHFLLPAVCQHLIHKNFPPELVDHVISEIDEGMTREMAESHRRNLMKDRTVTNPDLDGETWSLCEH